MAKKRKRNLYKGTQLRQRQDKDNAEYWRDRAIEREAFWNDKSRSTVENELAEQYRQAAQAIQNNIAALYGRFATENGLSVKDARALLKGKEFKEWRYDLERYVQLANGNDAILKELNTLAMRPRISRLEKLYSETLKELHNLGEKSSSTMKAFLEDAYKDNYYKGLFDIGQTAGIKGAISLLDSAAVERVVKNPWSGKNYSERIWKNQKQLANTIQKTVKDGIHRGLSVPKLSKMVQDRMNVGQYEATRLVRTELNYVHNQANLKSIEDSGLGFYEYVATLDKRTSKICRARDGQIIPVEEASPGNNLPPLHPHCRSTIIGSLGRGKGGQAGTRIARDNKGDTIYVPQQMTYDDYKAVYIDHTKALTRWADETGFKEDLAKYTPKTPIQGGNDGGIIESRKSITECTSHEELVKYWQEVHGVSIDDSVKALDFQSVKDATRGIENVLNEFPKAKQTLKKISTRAEGIMSATNDGTIAFNPAYFTDAKNLTCIKTDAASGWHPKNTGVLETGAHEAGHMLELALININQLDSIFGLIAWKDCTMAKGVVHKAMLLAKKTPDGKDKLKDQLVREVSRYAGKNASETLAEAVCDYMANGQKAAIMSRMIWQVLKKELS
jgi:SPP1 gp7 family putative phage head morphogenesis protein